MALNRGIREPKWPRRKERKLGQETRAVTSGRKASVDRPAWWPFMFRTTMALIIMKRSWESLRLAGNTMEESGCGSHGHCSRMGHWAILPAQLPPTPWAFAKLQRSETAGEKELRFTCQLLEHTWRLLSILYPSRWPCICLAREVAGTGKEEAVRGAHEPHTSHHLQGLRGMGLSTSPQNVTTSY